jgi:hyperosmotically inducible periplasmic protein
MKTAAGGRVGVKACAKVAIVGIMACVLLSGCAMAMLGGAARSGSGGASASGGTGAKPSSPAVSDSSISAAVRSRLSAHSTLKALKIVVDTHDGIVTLKGPVNTLADKSAAQAEARVVSGVKGVNNQLTVR